MLVIFCAGFFVFGLGIEAQASSASSYWKTYFSDTELKAVQKNAQKYTLAQIKNRSDQWHSVITGFNIKNGSISNDDIDSVDAGKVKNLQDVIDQRISGSSTPQTPQDFSADKLTGSYAALDGSQITNLNPTNISSGIFSWASGQTFPADKLAGTYAALDGSGITGITASQVGAIPYSGATGAVDLNGKNLINVGNVGIGMGSPTAILQLKAGTSAMNTAPLKFIAGQLMTTPEVGSMEFDNLNFYLTAASFNSDYPPAQNGTYVVSTTNDPSGPPYDATDPSLLVTGAWQNNGWASTSGTNQRLHIDLGSAKTITKIYYENGHSGGNSTTFGVKDFTLWGSNDPTAFSDTAYADNTNWVQLTTSTSSFVQHVSADIADPHYIPVTNSTPYRYYAFKFANTWGAGVMIVRRLELQEASGSSRAAIMTTNNLFGPKQIAYADSNGSLKGGSLVYDDTITNLSIGASTAVAKVGSITLQNVITGTHSSGWHGYENNDRLSFSGIGYAAYDAQSNIINDNITGHEVGFQSRMIYSGSTGLNSYLHSFDAAPAHSGTGTIANVMGLNINDITGTGVLTNDYGIYISPILRGSSKNYGIFVAGNSTPNYFAGNVGIGTTTPATALDVNGQVKIQKSSSQPFACDATHDGTIALTSGYRTCVCKGGSTTWVFTTDGTTTCTW